MGTDQQLVRHRRKDRSMCSPLELVISGVYCNLSIILPGGLESVEFPQPLIGVERLPGWSGRVGRIELQVGEAKQLADCSG
jgi:hypothetical protein